MKKCINDTIWNLQSEIIRLRSELHNHPTVEPDWYKDFVTFVDNIKTTFAKIKGVKKLDIHSFLLVKDICCEYDYLYDENDCTHVIDEVFEVLYEGQKFLAKKRPTVDQFIDRIMNELRENSITHYSSYYDVLVRELRFSRTNRSEKLTPDAWGEMLREDEKFLLSGKDDDGDEQVNQVLVKLSESDRLCCPMLKDEDKYDLYRVVNADNFLTFFKYALHINILLSETFPDTLKPQFEAWLKGEEASEPSQAQEEEKKKGGKQKEDLFTQEKTDEMKNCFLKYLRDNNLEPENVKLTAKQNDEINKVIVRWLKDLEQQKILVKNSYSKNAVFRFLTEICGLKKEVQEKAYANKLRDWLSN